LSAPLTKGSVVASDAFFPFADGWLVAVEAGATAVIQPGGSVARRRGDQGRRRPGIAMVFRGQGISGTTAAVSGRRPCRFCGQSGALAP